MKNNLGFVITDAWGGLTKEDLFFTERLLSDIKKKLGENFTERDKNMFALGFQAGETSLECKLKDLLNISISHRSKP